MERTAGWSHDRSRPFVGIKLTPSYNQRKDSPSDWFPRPTCHTWQAAGKKSPKALFFALKLFFLLFLAAHMCILAVHRWIESSHRTIRQPLNPHVASNRFSLSTLEFFSFHPARTRFFKRIEEKAWVPTLSFRKSISRGFVGAFQICTLGAAKALWKKTLDLLKRDPKISPATQPRLG